MNVFENKDQAQDWLELMQAIDDAPEIPACTNDPELFFLEGNRYQYDLQQIRNSCDPCPVRLQCLGYALKHAEYGVWGGLTPTERNRIRKRKAA